MAQFKKSTPKKNKWYDNNASQWKREDCSKQFPSIEARSRSSSQWNDDYIYCSTDFNHKFKDKRVLIIGGGQSTIELDWQNQKRDFTWSLNNCHLSENLKGTKIDLVLLGNAVNLEDSKLHEFFDKHKPFIGFEPHKKYTEQNKKLAKKWFKKYNYGTSKKYLNEEMYEKYGNLMFYSMCKFHSGIGIGSRAAILAASLGVKEMYLVGFDGPKSNIDKKHAFEKDKDASYLPNSYQRLTPDNMMKRYSQGYKHLAKILKPYNIKVINLAADRPYNIVKHILD
tara:strand:- start:589 stop:1434 length:846 start_codon:yes stop_codon:yes gene_type:complete